MRRIRRIRFAHVAAALLLAGCAVGPNYQAPDEHLPSHFSEWSSSTRPSTNPSAPGADQSVAESQQDYRQWWTAFHDEELNSLIDRALAGNPDIAAAEARIREARANRGVIASGLWPALDADASYTHERLSANIPGIAAFTGGGTSFPGIESDLWQAGFDASWEIDVFGGTRRAIESATYSVQAAKWDARDVRVSLISEVAVNYIALRSEQYQLQIAHDNVSSQRKTLDLTQEKANGGLVPYLDVAQQEAQVDSTEATIPSFESQVRQSIHHLSILLGMEPGALAHELETQAPVPVGPPSVPPGIPSNVLMHRPDVREAERQLAAATAQIGVATADLYPKFSITGALGLESGELKKFFDSASRTYNIAPGVTWDIFDAGKVSSNIKVQDARQAEALQAYRKAVLQALADVDDSLVAYNREQLRLQTLDRGVKASQQAYDLSDELFEKGSTDYLSVLDAQRTLFVAQTAEAQSAAQVGADLVTLYKALGGGWQWEDDPALCKSSSK